eukprot:CAMPEP_0113682480 /NCGR_PEP_ID=MMETSP0038_2-20120614/12689_1 /TAXON_ID=2898 /ORGANISM="Cryptomonas paramecium" /LENGTH=385 /DNA_ID=CAMNT_0000601559 /DNA_START=157 /DNA_END=1314 /DNA_ORIENTATION=- /assembly_acc=CAM_ASM_000170
MDRPRNTGDSPLSSEPVPSGHRARTILDLASKISSVREEIVSPLKPVRAYSHRTQSLAEVSSLFSSPKNVSNANASKSVHNQVVYCVLSAPRANVSYLVDVLNSFRREDLGSKSPSISVIYIDPSDVATAQLASAKTAGQKQKQIGRPDVEKLRYAFPDVRFQKIVGRQNEGCSLWEMEHNRGQLGNISCQVRQQSRDVATAIKQCSAGLSPESWVVLVEDDTPICPGGARQIATVLASISNTSTPFRFKTAHFSETFSGTAFPVEAVEFFATYLLQNLAARPPDHLVDEHWWSDRRDFIYNGNLFLHNGYVSAFPVRNSGAFHEELDKRRFDSRKVTCIEALPYQVERAIQRPVPRGKKRKPRGVGKQQPAPMTNATKRQAAAS